MANGMTALLVAITVASGAPAGAAGAAPSGSSWEAKNRERARAGLLPRKLPPPRSRLSTVAAGAPTAVPSVGATVATPALAATAIPTATTVPTATATVIPPASAPATAIPIPPATAPANPMLATTPPAALPAAATPITPAPASAAALAAATPTAPSAPAQPAPPSPAANPLQVSLVPTSPARLVSATADVRGDVAAPRVDSVLVTRMGDMRLVVTRPSGAPAAARTASLARPQHPPGLLSRSWTAAGEQVHRVVDPDGRISERRVDTRGLVVEARVVGDATALPLVWQKRRTDGNVVQVVQDAASGALIALTRDGGGHLVDARVQPRDGLEG